MLNFSIQMLLPWFVAFGFCLLRSSGVFLAIPTVGGETIPMRLRVTAAAAVSLSMLPTVGKLQMTDPMALTLFGTGELMMGLSMGLVLQMILSTAEMAGELNSMQMGLGFAKIVDPMSGTSSDALSHVLKMTALLLFLAVGGHHTMIASLSNSYQQVPIGTVLPSAMYAKTILPLLSTVIATSVCMAAPILVAILLTQGALGLLTRAAQQLNMFGLAFGVTIVVGIIILNKSLHPTMTVFLQLVNELTSYLSSVVLNGTEV